MSITQPSHYQFNKDSKSILLPKESWILLVEVKNGSTADGYELYRCYYDLLDQRENWSNHFRKGNDIFIGAGGFKMKKSGTMVDVSKHGQNITIRGRDEQSLHDFMEPEVMLYMIHKY